MTDIVERARARLQHIKDDGDAVLIDMLVTYIERLEAECTPRWMQIAHEQQEEIERLRAVVRVLAAAIKADDDGYHAVQIAQGALGDD